MSTAIRKPLEERFWEKVNKTEGCWEWTAYKGANGYGQIGKGTREQGTLLAHRLSYEMARGPIPEGIFIDHVCHNRGCVRPDHLRLATVKENAENLSGLRKDNTSGVTGVSWNRGTRSWAARVQHNSRTIYIGLFSTIQEAESAVVAKRLELFTHNEIDKRRAA